MVRKLKIVDRLKGGRENGPAMRSYWPTACFSVPSGRAAWRSSDHQRLGHDRLEALDIGADDDGTEEHIGERVVQRNGPVRGREAGRWLRSRHVSQGRVSAAWHCRGNEQRTFVEKHSFDMPPPTTVLSSRVLACHGKIRQCGAALSVSEDEE